MPQPTTTQPYVTSYEASHQEDTGHTRYPCYAWVRVTFSDNRALVIGVAYTRPGPGETWLYTFNAYPMVLRLVETVQDYTAILGSYQYCPGKDDVHYLPLSASLSPPIEEYMTIGVSRLKELWGHSLGSDFLIEQVWVVIDEVSKNLEQLLVKWPISTG